MTAATATPLLISGLPGPMAAEVAALAAQSAGVTLLPVGLTSEARHGSRFSAGETTLRLVAPGREPLDLPPGTIAVDFSTPRAALRNARWFVGRGLPFVMGTTGFDAAELTALMKGARAPAVVAPNMAPPIVLLQAAMRWLGAEFPGACGGATLSVRESHQQGKRDTSGTARALVEAFRRLGLDFDDDAIDAIRDPAVQREQLGVPAGFLDAHAFHRYQLGLAGDTVRVVLEHDVLGRRVYAEGTLRAVRFLRARIAEGVTGRVYDMEDVLRGG